MDGEDFLGPYGNWFDKFVLFPPSEHANNVPHWSANDGTKNISIDYKSDKKENYYAALYIQEELEEYGYSDAVPYKIFTFNTAINMDVKVDDYVFVLSIFEKTGQRIFEKKL